MRSLSGPTYSAKVHQHVVCSNIFSNMVLDASTTNRIYISHRLSVYVWRLVGPHSGSRYVLCQWPKSQSDQTNTLFVGSVAYGTSTVSGLTNRLGGRQYHRVGHKIRILVWVIGLCGCRGQGKARQVLETTIEWTDDKMAIQMGKRVHIAVRYSEPPPSLYMFKRTLSGMVDFPHDYLALVAGAGRPF